MKESTLQTLITARTLVEQAERHCALGDRYMATAGLIVLQDAVELVFLATLIEMGVDEDTAVEKLDFDQMIAALGKIGIKVPKSGTLKAMNKLRVAAKHYGQVMEPATVQGHLNASKFAVDSILTAAVGKPLREIFLTELISDGQQRNLLEEAAACLARRQFFECLVATRKAFFLEFERNYCIYQFRDKPDDGTPKFGILGMVYGGYKAPYWMRNSAWISKNVETPFDYVQLNSESWRLDALEWGINTQSLSNIRRLTPKVVQLENDGAWLLHYPASYIANSATRENAAMCLDLTIEVIRRKREYTKSARTVETDKSFDMPTAYIGQPLFERPDTGSNQLKVLGAGDQYVVHDVLNGFQPGTLFYHINCTNSIDERAWGYIERIEEVSLQEDTPAEEEVRVDGATPDTVKPEPSGE